MPGNSFRGYSRPAKCGIHSARPPTSRRFPAYLNCIGINLAERRLLRLLPQLGDDRREAVQRSLQVVDDFGGDDVGIGQRI